MRNLARLDFESISVEEDSYKQTETTKWIRKGVPISVFVSSNLIQEPVFLCNTDGHHLVSIFITALVDLATQIKAQMNLRFTNDETPIKLRLLHILEQLNQRHSRAELVVDFVDNCIVDCEEKDLSTQFLQEQENHFFF